MYSLPPIGPLFDGKSLKPWQRHSLVIALLATSPIWILPLIAMSVAYFLYTEAYSFFWKQRDD